MPCAPEGVTGITIHYNHIYLMLALCGQNLSTKCWVNQQSAKLRWRLCAHAHLCMCVCEVIRISTMVYVLLVGMWCLDTEKKRNAGQNPCHCYVLHKHKGGSEETLMVIAGVTFEKAVLSTRCLLNISHLTSQFRCCRQFTVLASYLQCVWSWASKSRLF